MSNTNTFARDSYRLLLIEMSNDHTFRRGRSTIFVHGIVEVSHLSTSHTTWEATAHRAFRASPKILGAGLGELRVGNVRTREKAYTEYTL